MKKNDVLQFVKFSIAGVINTVLDYLLFFLFFSVCNWDKNIAQILATSFAMANSYLLNRYWTFGQTGMIRTKEIWKFIVVNFLSLLTTLLCLNLFYDAWHLYEVINAALHRLHIAFALRGESAVLACKVLAFPFSSAINFLGNRLWVFKK